MKAKLSPKTTLRISMQGKAVTKVLTVFLCAFSFALFALASTGYTYSKKEYYTRALMHYSAETFGATRVYASLLGEEGISRFEETGMDFAYLYQADERNAPWDAPLRYYLNDYNRYRYELTYAERRLVSEEEYERFRPYGGTKPAVFGESAGEALGVKVLAGRYLQSVHEIAVSEAVFDDFRRNGYVDNSANMIYLDKGRLPDGTLHHDPATGEIAPESPGGSTHLLEPNDGDVFTGYHFFGLGNCGEREPIESYDDLLGKEVVLYGNLETGVLDESGIYAAKIVGVLDTSALQAEGMRGPVFSEAWREVFLEGHDDLCTEMIAPPVQSMREARELVELTLELLEEYLQEHSVMSKLQLGAVPVTDLIDLDPQFNNEKLIFTVGGGAGLLFGVFSVLLCWHLTTSSLVLKKRKIGVLRALGANEADVRRIVLFEALFVTICSFLLSLLLSLGVFYGVMRPLTYIERFGVSLLNFTGWNVLILAAFSFAVPLLCTVVPLRRFLKKPIVENISGNIPKG